MVGEKWEERGKEAKRGNVSVRPSVYAAKEVLKTILRTLFVACLAVSTCRRETGFSDEENSLSLGTEGEIQKREDSGKGNTSIHHLRSIPRSVCCSRGSGVEFERTRRSRRKSSYRGRYIPHSCSSALLIAPSTSKRRRPANRRRGVVRKS